MPNFLNYSAILNGNYGSCPAGITIVYGAISLPYKNDSPDT